MAKIKTIFRQVDQLFSMTRRFGESKVKIKDQGDMGGSIVGGKTFVDYRAACMRWAEDLAERRGGSKFQICSVKPEEIKNFLDRIALAHRPETVHQYCAALQKLENMTNDRFGKVKWNIGEYQKPKRKRGDVTVQRGPAYTSLEANRLIRKLTRVDKRGADALKFIRATGCRAETIFGRQVSTGGKVVVNGRVIKGSKVRRDFDKAVTADRIDLVKGTVTLFEKGGKWRTVVYDRRYQGLMERLVKDNPEGPIFNGLNQSTMYDRIKIASGQSGFEGRGFHGMRKTFAVQRHKVYTQRINDLVKRNDWQTLAKDFSITKQKAQAICDSPQGKSIDTLARLRLSLDLGHNRIEVTYRYVPK
jgi:integrase